MHRKIKIAVILLVLLGLAACSKDEAEQVLLDEIGTEQTEAEVPEETDHIFVNVCGAVLYEGVYELPAGSRVYEAIEMAGGFCENAAVSQINQAEILEDETQLYIPTIEEIIEGQSQDDGKVNLNTATREELMTLPGVGEAKADLIIEYRETNGKFHTIEDVMNISGIKEGLFGKIKDYIKV